LGSVILWEVTNGLYEDGTCPLRVYVWAPYEGEALDMARGSFHREAIKDPRFASIYPPPYWMDLRAEALFSLGDAPFVTAPSSRGWRREGEEIETCYRTPQFSRRAP
jgi:hypothetical protein